MSRPLPSEGGFGGVALPMTLGTTALAVIGIALVSQIASEPSGFDVPICRPYDLGGSAWTFDAWVTVPLFVSAMLYGGGLVRLWGRVGIGRGAQPMQAVAYGLGWLALAGALVGPLHRWGEQLFTAHMVEHELVMAVAAPLLVLARPGAVLMWAFPRRVRHRIGRVVRSRNSQSVWILLSGPLAATLLHGLAIWGWHAPPLFDAAVLHVALHRIQHVAFLVTALLFWWSMLRRSAPGGACGHLFLTMMHTTLLGALLALAPHVLYPDQTARAADWGLTPLEDQQLAGLIMWVPAGTVYAGAALALLAGWIRRSGAGWRGVDELRRA